MILQALVFILLFSMNTWAQNDPCADRILVAGTGDIMVHDAQQREAHSSPEKFYALWKSLTPYISLADIAYGNLESPVALGIDGAGRDRGDIGFRYDLQVYSGTKMIFNYHPQVLTDLRKLGFDVLSTANNHAMDRRAIGINRTLEELIRGGWSFTGTRFSDGRGEWGITTQVKDRNIYWLSCTEHLNGNKDHNNQVLRCFDQQSEIESLVKRAFVENDAVILTPHWGDEYSQKPAARQIKWAQRMSQLGVTAIIGNHPHVLQPLERINSMWVAYSLGNFSAWQKGVERKTSGILYLDLRPNGSGKLHVSRVKALPIYRLQQSMYPYYNTVSSEALQYVVKHFGADKIVRGVDFQRDVLSCDN